MWLGLFPKLVSQSGDYSEVIWKEVQWSQMLESREQKNAWLDFPPLVLPKSYGSHVIIAFLMRNGDNLDLYGGFHPKVSPNVSSCQIKFVKIT